MKKGNIIFLNGVSSSGKTTLAKALQAQLDEPYHLFNVDVFTGKMVDKEKLLSGKFGMDWFYKALSGFHHTIKLYSDMGINIIVDHVMLKINKAMPECVRLLHEYPVILVHVTCPLDELQHRERKRCDRPIGLSESQLADLEPQDIYDIVIDTYKNTQVECVNKIIEALKSIEATTAFKKLWSQQQSFS